MQKMGLTLERTGRRASQSGLYFAATSSVNPFPKLKFIQIETRVVRGWKGAKHSTFAPKEGIRSYIIIYKI